MGTAAEGTNGEGDPGGIRDRRDPGGIWGRRGVIAAKHPLIVLATAAAAEDMWSMWSSNNGHPATATADPRPGCGRKARPRRQLQPPGRQLLDLAALAVGFAEQDGRF